MNWQDHRTLAAAYRDQGLADYLAARVVQQVGPAVPLRDGVTASLAHVVVVKCQQASEKMFKGYRLWHSPTFNPTAGHVPLSAALPQVGQSGPSADAVTNLVAAMNRANGQLVAELRWLEGMAPVAPSVPPALAGTLLPLALLVENAEYPFWSPPAQRLVLPATALSYAIQGRRAVGAVTAFCRVLARSDPRDFTNPIRACLSMHDPVRPIALDADRPEV